MGIRTGDAYKKGLDDSRALYIDGQRVSNPNDYAPLHGIINTIAEHYDSFHDPKLQPDYTYASGMRPIRPKVASLRRVSPFTRCSTCSQVRASRKELLTGWPSLGEG